MKCMLLSLLMMIPCEAAVLLREGDSVVVTFDSMTPAEDHRNSWVLYYGFGSRSFTIGETYRIRVFEDNILEEPLLDREVGTASTFGSSGVSFTGMIFGGHFQDMQGVALIDMLNGEVGIEEISFATFIDDVAFTVSIDQFTPIPEPSVPTVLLLALLSCALMRRCDRVTNDPATRQLM